MIFGRHAFIGLKINQFRKETPPSYFDATFSIINPTIIQTQIEIHSLITQYIKYEEFRITHAIRILFKNDKAILYFCTRLLYNYHIHYTLTTRSFI